MEKCNLNEFPKSQDPVRRCKDNKFIFTSCKDRLSLYLEYAARFMHCGKFVTVFGYAVSNANALLFRKNLCRGVYNHLRSENALCGLEASDIEYYFNEDLPRIEDNARQNMYPPERMSRYDCEIVL